MGNTEHTSGPLSVIRHATPDYAPQFGIYADGQSHDLAIVKGDNAEADAHLFAAAPELLGALRLLRGFGCPACNGDCASANPPVSTCPMQVAGAAIAKATGR